MRRCGNCKQVGHNRQTCKQAGSIQPVLRSTGSRQSQTTISPVVNTLYNCPGINGVGSHTVNVLESDTTLSFIMDKQRNSPSRGGGATVRYCPTHRCRMTRA